MPTSAAAGVFAKMAAVEAAVRKSQLLAVRRAAAVVKDSNLAGTPRRLRNVGRNGANLGVSYKVVNGPTPTAYGRATGPWPLIENDTPAHIILPKASRKAKAVLRRAGLTTAAIGGVVLPDGAIRRSVNHPGTKGKHLFKKTTVAAAPRAVEELGKTTVNAVRGVFG